MSALRDVGSLAVYLVYFLALLGSYCQMAPAVAGAVRGWETGDGRRYALVDTVIFREVGPPRPGGDVGFRLTGELHVTAVWRDPNDLDAFLLKFELLSPQLWIKSRRAPEPEGFVEHSSRVKEVGEKPFLALWRRGEIRAFYADPTDSVSALNLKRGLVSLFQYRTLDEEVRERDASGTCDVAYASLGPRTVEKRKSNCAHDLLSWRTRHPNPIFAIGLASERNSTYVLTHSLLPERVVEDESHRMTLAFRSDIGAIVLSERRLERSDDPVRRSSAVTADSVQRAIALLYPEYEESNLQVQPEPFACPDVGCPTLEQTVEEYREALSTSALGTAKSASAFLELMPLVRNASMEKLLEILKTPRNRDIRMQLLDIYGSACTLPAHRAAMKLLRQDEMGEETERYLWALSLSPTPNIDVVANILKRSEETMQNDKVSETYALSAAAMARHHGSPDVVEKARISLELGLDTCTGQDCRLKFLRALRNLQSPAAVPTLLNYAFGQDAAVGVAAWRALAALPRQHVSDRLKTAARKIFYQMGGSRRDSSARTIALDIILENEPSEEDLRDLVEYWRSGDSAYEVRKYLGQRLRQMAERKERFARYLANVYAGAAKHVYNYDKLAQRGLSTAFTRHFLRSNDGNGSLVTVQEVRSGLLKRGIVDVVLETGEHRQAVFSLGLFAGGLGAYASSQNDEEEEAEDEAATAGMEIDLLGVGVRPFVFFYGNSELTGHLWSGTASERTSAFEALAALYSHAEYVPLGSGFVAEMDVRGATSFDLAGQITFSLWSRTGRSLVEMAAGTMIRGGMEMRSSFVRSKARFSLTMEPKLQLFTDVDFSGPVSLCMKLSQPVTTVKHQIYKIERIPGSRHRLRKTRSSKIHSPGRSYRLNRKNNEMCSRVFS